MKHYSEREAILKMIRKGVKDPSSSPAKEYHMTVPSFCDFSSNPQHLFAEQFSSQGGKYFYCHDEYDLKDHLESLFHYRRWEKVPVYGEKLYEYLSTYPISVVQGDADSPKDLGCCQCRYLISSTGGIVLTSNQDFGNNFNALPKKLMVIAFSTQLVETTWDVYRAFPLQPVSYLLTITPSFHKDFGIEELYVFLLKRSFPNT